MKKLIVVKIPKNSNIGIELPPFFVCNKIKFGEHSILACPPKSLFESPPSDQPGPELEECPTCEFPMWTSKKKRSFVKENKKSKMHCYYCIIANILSQEIDPESFEICNFNEMQ